MKKIAIFVVMAGSVRAQVTLRFTPEPMAIPIAQLGSAHALGRWIVEGCNDGSATVTLPVERIDMAAGPIGLIDADDTLIALTGAQQKTVAGTVARVGSILGESAAIGAAIAKVNPLISTMVALGSAATPQIVTIAKGQIPAIAPLLSEIRYPVTLPPGGCFTDHRFAAKMSKVSVFTARIELAPAVLRPTATPASVVLPEVPAYPQFEIPRSALLTTAGMAARRQWGADLLH